MKKLILAASLLLAACGQSGTSATSTATAPLSLMQQAQAKAPEEQPVFAYQTLASYQTAHPDPAVQKCERVRSAFSYGVIPADVAPNTPMTPFVGDLVYSVQCGPQLTTVGNDPHQHWLVVLAPNAADATVVSCADAHGVDQCPFHLPHASATTTGTATTAP